MTMAKAVKISPENIIEDWGSFEDWANGDSVAPSDWVATGTAGSIAKESTIIKDGLYAMKIISGASATYAAELSYANYDVYAGRTVRFGMWVYCASASKARIYIDDGITVTYSSYHTGGGSFEFLEVGAQISSVNTKLVFGCQVAATSVTAYFDAGIAVEGEVIFTQLQTTRLWLMEDNIAPSINIGLSTFEVARKEGVYFADAKLGTRSIKMTVKMFGDTFAETRAYYDALVKAVLEGKKHLYIEDDRVIKVICSGISKIKYEADFYVYTVDINFIAPMPYAQYVGKLRKKQTISASPTSFNLTVNGSYKTRPYIAFNASGGTISSFTLENQTTGQVMSFTGTIVNGGTLAIDCENQIVLNNQVDAVSVFTGDFLHFVPGTNYLKATVSSGVIKADWFDRWV